MKQNVCCLIGQRKITLEQTKQIFIPLLTEISTTIQEGYNHFIIGVSSDADLLFFGILEDFQKTYPITFEAIATHKNQLVPNGYLFKSLIKNATKASFFQKMHNAHCVNNRDAFVVSLCDRVIALYDDKKANTRHSIIQLAYSLKKDVRIIVLPNKKGINHKYSLLFNFLL